MPALKTLEMMKQAIGELATAADSTTVKLSGMIDPFYALRGEIKKLGTEASTTADRLRGMGAVGLKSATDTAAAGGMKSMAEITAIDLENMARALKPALDKIDRRQL